MKKTVLCGMMVMGAFLGGCAGKAKMDEQQATAPVPPVAGDQLAGQDTSGAREQAVTEAPAAVVPAAPEADKLVTVLFEFDSYVLSDASRQALTRNAEWLKKHPEVKITVEGHADERGSDEYNMALGERRAQVAREFLEGLGISADRLKTISYGEEKPVAQGQDEESWAKNRRAEFL